MSDKEIILVGYSGHAYVVAETAIENGLNIIGYSDKTRADNNPYKLNYLGFENNEGFVGWEKEVAFILGIGDNKIRQNVAELIQSKGKKLTTVIHKAACISNNVILGNGCFVNKNVSVNAFTVIGANVILNTGCIVEHECVINEAAHIAPGAVLAGNVNVGERSFIGANAVIKQGVIIGKDVIIGAGSVVLKNVPDGSKIVGNPGRQL